MTPSASIECEPNNPAEIDRLVTPTGELDELIVDVAPPSIAKVYLPVERAVDVVDLKGIDMRPAKVTGDRLP